jgi:hypothetical protein
MVYVFYLHDYYIERRVEGSRDIQRILRNKTGRPAPRKRSSGWVALGTKLRLHLFG